MMYNKKKVIGIILVIIIVISLLAGCGQRTEENRTEEIYESEAENDQTDRQTEVPTEAEVTSQETSSNEAEEITGTTENEVDKDNYAWTVEPFIDEELYLYIKGVYDEIDWDIQFLPGDESKQDLYREQFIKLLKEEIPVDEGDGYETTISKIGEIRYDVNYPDYDPNHYNYYYFDVDGDGAPELGLTNNQRFVYIFKYEEDTDRVVVWRWYVGPIDIVGTGKFYQYTWMTYEYMGLDENEDYIRLAWFKVAGGKRYESAGDDGWAFFVALPEYMEPEDWMLTQATYDDNYKAYFFRVTREQYDELEERFLESLHESNREMEEVTYTYEELLNLK